MIQNIVLNMKMTSPTYREAGIQPSKICFLVQETCSSEIEENLNSPKDKML